MLKAFRPLGLCLLHRAPVESVQIGVTVSGQHLAFLCVWERSNLFFRRRSDLARRSEALQFESGPPKMFVLRSRLNHVPCLSDA